jgi:hypothetical protein
MCLLIRMLLNTDNVVAYFRVRYLSHCYAITRMCNHDTVSDRNLPARCFLLPQPHVRLRIWTISGISAFCFIAGLSYSHIKYTPLSWQSTHSNKKNIYILVRALLERFTACLLRSNPKYGRTTGDRTTLRRAST